MDESYIFDPEHEIPAAEDVRSLFPLRLTPFENYMHVDDRRSHPMSFIIEIAVSGDLRLDAMQKAIATALRRHPLLTARVGWHTNGRNWLPCPVPPSVQVVSPEAIHELKVPWVNIRREAGVRMWIVPERDGGRLFFSFHHAATDGIGAIQFIGDILVYYARQTAAPGQELPELRAIDVNTLRDRGCLANPLGVDASGHVERFRGLCRQLGRSASELAVPSVRPLKTSSNTLETMPPYVGQTIDRDPVKELKRSAAKRMLHLNDLMVASAFKTAHDWNRKSGVGRGDGLLRMALPASLRTPKHDLSPAANIVSMVFVNRRESECGDLHALLAMASDSTNASTHDRMFPKAMRIGRMIPGLMEVCSRLPYRFATMVLTNVGDVKRNFGSRFPMDRGRCVAGSLIYEGLRGSAPLRPGTHLCLAAGLQAGQLLVNAACDPRHYSRRDADEILDIFLSHLDELNVEAAARRAA